MAAPLIRADGFVAPCIPTLAGKPPSGPDLVHEIKHDGYRLIVRRDGPSVCLFTRCGFLLSPALRQTRDWIKVKNPDSPAMRRAREARW
jgi:ATP-dependent DNA ligase